MLNINKIINSIGTKGWVNDILDEIVQETIAAMPVDDRNKYEIKNASHLTQGKGYLFLINMKGAAFTFDELEVAIIKQGCPLNKVSREQVKEIIEKIIESRF